MYNLIIIGLIILILVSIYCSDGAVTVEGFWDVLPYDYHWNMFKCLDMECLKKQTKICHDACSEIKKKDKFVFSDDQDAKVSTRENCKMRCMDFADQYSEQLKLNNILWNRILPNFDKVALYKN
jgi:hypothetical protein